MLGCRELAELNDIGRWIWAIGPACPQWIFQQWLGISWLVGVLGFRELAELNDTGRLGGYIGLTVLGSALLLSLTILAFGSWGGRWDCVGAYV